MENENFFEKTGKHIHYEVPADFFDSITEKTLQKAKIRIRKSQKRNLIIWTSVAAAVLVILAFTALDIYQLIRIKNTEIAVQTEKNLPEPGILIDKDLKSMIESLSVYDMIAIENEQLPISKEILKSEEETFENMIATLTEDELLILAGQISAEISINLLIEE